MTNIFLKIEVFYGMWFVHMTCLKKKANGNYCSRVTPQKS